MLTPITCLTLVCDGCGTTAEDDDGGGPEGPYLGAICLRCGHWLDLGPVGAGVASTAGVA